MQFSVGLFYLLALVRDVSYRGLRLGTRASRLASSSFRPVTTGTSCGEAYVRCKAEEAEGGEEEVIRAFRDIRPCGVSAIYARRLGTPTLGGHGLLGGLLNLHPPCGSAVRAGVRQMERDGRLRHTELRFQAGWASLMGIARTRPNHFCWVLPCVRMGL